ncbi:MAG TPA: DNA topoisomerase IB [Eoetvoesiella sp.]
MTYGSAEPLSVELVYVNDQQPGIARKRFKDGFRYTDSAGKVITDKDTLARINALMIPPAYEKVWICSSASGHLQATGRDARGRKQYRYHERWAQIRDADKYQQLLAFGSALPRIRRQVKKDLARRELCQAKIIASVVRLLDTTLIRVGSRAYAHANKSYGLTTLKRGHATVTADRIRFRFKGKSGVEHDVTVTDARVARIVRRCMDIPGHQLFHYKDEEGALRSVDSNAVNAYLKEAAGTDFTAKDYRTWAGSVSALAALQRRSSTSEINARQAVADVVKEVAQRLGNTPAICRKCYIHPEILEAYLQQRLPPRLAAPAGSRNLSADEKRLLKFLSEQSNS